MINVGDIKQYRGRIVAVMKTGDAGVVAMDIFTYHGTGKIDPSDLKDCDVEVLKFTSLMAHAPQMTHDEIKKQIEMLFGAE